MGDEFGGGYVATLAEYARAQVQLPPDVLKKVNDWANDILDDKLGARHAAIAIQQGLQGPDGFPDQGIIARCGASFVSNVQTAQMALPFDDRVWFNSMAVLGTMYVTWQTRALQMIREARHWRAVQLYKDALNQSVATTCGGILSPSCPAWTPENVQPDADQLCLRATDPDLALNSTSPVLAARQECKDLKADEDRFHKWTVSQYEDMGVALSTGERPGDGLRLLLGVDYLVSENAQKDLKAPPGSDPFDGTRTRYLVPASLAAFDPRCQGSTVAELASNGCSVLGGPEDGNERWTDTTFRLGYPSRAWKPGGREVWETLRYGLSVSKVYSAVGGGSLLEWMDKGFNSHVAFTNMTNLTFWIHNHKFYSDLIDNIDLKVRDGRGRLRDELRPVYGRDVNRYWIPSSHGLYNIRGFVNKNATDKRGGPSGIVMYGPDMAAVSSQWWWSWHPPRRVHAPRSICTMLIFFPSPGFQRRVQSAGARPRRPLYVRRKR